MKKVQFFLFVLSLVMLSLACSAGISPAFYQLQVNSYSYKPSTVYAGNEVSIAVSIYNKSTITAQDIKLKLSAGDYFKNLDVEKNIDKIFSKETRTVAFRVKAADNIPAGTYNLSLELNYSNGGEKISDYATVPVTVSEIYRVSLENLSVSDFYPHIGETTVIKADVKNTGSIEARNVSTELSLLGSDDFGKFIVLSDTIKEIETLGAGKTATFQFKLKPSEKIEPGVFSFKLTAKCLDCKETASEKFALHVYGYPELFISGVDYSVKGRDTKNLIQGDVFSLSVQLDNSGKEEVKKVQINITTDDDILGTKKSYVGSIDADDSSAGLFDLEISPTAKVGYHTVGITVTYLDELGKEKKIQDSFKFYVSKKPAPNPYIPFILVIVILVIVYFIIKMIFRQLAIRKM